MAIETVLTEAVKTDPRPAWQQLSIDKSEDQIVLINPDLGPTDRPFRNLLRRTKENRVVWRAELPDPDAIGAYDSYVQIRWSGSHVAANTWSGYYVLINAKTGQVTKIEFVK